MRSPSTLPTPLRGVLPENSRLSSLFWKNFPDSSEFSILPLLTGIKAKWGIRFAPPNFFLIFVGFPWYPWSRSFSVTGGVATACSNRRRNSCPRLVDVRLDVAEHSPNDVPFSAIGFPPNDGTGKQCFLGSIVRRVVVVNVNACCRQGIFESGNDFGNAGGFVVTWKQNGNLGWQREGHW